MEKKNELNYNDKDHNKHFVIFCFGVSVEGHSVCIKIKNYNPNITKCNKSIEYQDSQVQIYFFQLKRCNLNLDC